MTKEEAKKEREALEKRIAELTAIIEKPVLTPEDLFFQLIEGLIIKTDRKAYPDSVFFFNSKDEYVMEIEKSIIWFCYSLFWSKFYDAFSWDYDQTQAFLKKMVEEHFKMKDVTTNCSKNWSSSTKKTINP